MTLLFDASLIKDKENAFNFITLLLQASTEYSIIGKDLKGNIILWNEGAKRIYGYEPEEIVGKLNASVLHTPEDIKNKLPEKILKEALTHGKWQGHIQRVKKNGSHFLAYAVVTPIIEDDKRVKGFLLISKDISEKMRLEKLEQQNTFLKEAATAKNKYLTDISHELRTPLNAILGYAGTLLMKMPGPLNNEQEKQINTIKKSATHLLALINGLMDLAKIEAKKVVPNFERIKTIDLLKEVINLISPLAEQKGLSIDLNFSENIEIYSDKRLLTQILINIINNAIKFTTAGNPEIKIRKERRSKSQYVIFDIIDSGVGIATNEQHRIFSPFQQIENPGLNVQGTGLGLHISKKIAKLLHGRLEFKSEYGKGTIFSLFIPLTEESVRNKEADYLAS